MLQMQGEVHKALDLLQPLINWTEDSPGPLSVSKLHCVGTTNSTCGMYAVIVLAIDEAHVYAEQARHP